MIKPIHFRRCHLCGSVNHSEQGRIVKCSYCHKSLSSFYYYDERFIAVQGDTTLRPVLLQNEYSPIQGLTVYWESY